MLTQYSKAFGNSKILLRKNILPKVGFYPTIWLMALAAKKLSITLPTDLERALAETARREHRTMSGVIQESARCYLRTKASEKKGSGTGPKVRRAFEFIRKIELRFEDGKTAEEAIREMRDSR